MLNSIEVTHTGVMLALLSRPDPRPWRLQGLALMYLLTPPQLAARFACVWGFALTRDKFRFTSFAVYLDSLCGFKYNFDRVI